MFEPTTTLLAVSTVQLLLPLDHHKVDLAKKNKIKETSNNRNDSMSPTTPVDAQRERECVCLYVSDSLLFDINLDEYQDAIGMDVPCTS